jgi:hypothetical protein
MRVMHASESKVMHRRCRMRRRDEGQLLVRDWEMREERRARLATLVMIIPARARARALALRLVQPCSDHWTGGKKRDELELLAGRPAHPSENRWCRPAGQRASELLHSTRYVSFRFVAAAPARTP